MRVLLDANIYISYLLSPGVEGTVQQIIDAAFAGQIRLLVSPQLLDELARRIPSKPYLSERVSQEQLTHFLTLLATVAETVPNVGSDLPLPKSRDPKDDYLLATALVGQADYLVTGDKDLLVLDKVGSVKMASPAQFVSLLGAGE